MYLCSLYVSVVQQGADFGIDALLAGDSRFSHGGGKDRHSDYQPHVSGREHRLQDSSTRGKGGGADKLKRDRDRKLKGRKDTCSSSQSSSRSRSGSRSYSTYSSSGSSTSGSRTRSSSSGSHSSYSSYTRFPTLCLDVPMYCVILSSFLAQHATCHM